MDTNNTKGIRTKRIRELATTCEVRQPTPFRKLHQQPELKQQFVPHGAKWDMKQQASKRKDFPKEMCRNGDREENNVINKSGGERQRLASE